MCLVKVRWAPGAHGLAAGSRQQAAGHDIDVAYRSLQQRVGLWLEPPIWYVLRAHERVEHTEQAMDLQQLGDALAAFG